MYKRVIGLPDKQTFFLLGPRQTGKSSLLRKRYPSALFIDLLKHDEMIRLKGDPSLLRDQVRHLLQSSKDPIVVVDEVQKIPELLDEVHHLIEEHKRLKFILAGSSARKLKKMKANLLGGRAWVRELHGLVFPEFGDAFDLGTVLNRESLPQVYDSPDYTEFLRAYVGTYLKEEILDEGLSRNLPAFSSFLNLASLSDTETVEYQKFVQDVGVSAPTIKSYFEILSDTLIGTFLPVYRKRPKRRLSLAPKFCFFDVGVVNHLAKRGKVEPDSELWGKAFENYLFHELNAYRSYRSPDLDLSFWRLSSKIEVDFILRDMEVVIEVKGSSRFRPDYLHGLRELKVEHPKVKRRILVMNGGKPRLTEDGIEILSITDFLKTLWDEADPFLSAR